MARSCEIYRKATHKGRLGGAPYPRHPAARPPLRQQTENPKRVDCLGFFYFRAAGTNCHPNRFGEKDEGGGIPIMADSELVVAYRLNAAKCTELAHGCSDLGDRIAMLTMAQAWLRLADTTEKLGAAVQNVPPPPAPGRA